MLEAPVFPLPNHVVFPHISMPYRLFEERYRALGAHIMEHQDQGLFIPRLEDGWEKDYEGQPTFEAYAVHCRVDRIEVAENGEYAMLITGGERYQLHEIESDHPFRMVKATEAKVDHDMSDGALQQSLLLLAKDFRSNMSNLGAPIEELRQFLDSCSSSCELLNRMAHLLFSDPVMRQQFLNNDRISDQVALLRLGLGHRQHNDVSMN